MDAVGLDVSDPEQIAHVSEHLIAKYPALNALINNAGIMPFDDVTGPLDDAQARAASSRPTCSAQCE